ncbi:MAG: membrane protein insertion efficiency factor YidD [Candidatus Bathyarchaeota archaeon]
MFIRVYQKVTENWCHACLYHPSCSEYSILAYQKYSFWEASVLTCRRLLDCHPFSDRPRIDYP